MKQTKTLASGFPVMLDDERAKYVAREVKYEETIESLRQQLHAQQICHEHVIAEKDAEIERLEEERDDALQGPWAEWAEKSLKIIREHTGYDGYDDQSNGVDLPNELSEAFNELEAEEERLRQQLAASQAREQQLREALYDTNDFVERNSNRWDGITGKHPCVVVEASRAALAQPQDTSALEAIITKAGEVMRERAIKSVDLTPYRLVADERIRALPSVTLEDLK